MHKRREELIMKKWLIILTSMLVIGGVGSGITSMHTVNKTNAYLNERRTVLTVNEDLLNTDAKINTIRIDSLAPNTTVNVKKSTDNKVTAKVKSIYGEKIFKANIENNNLVITSDDVMKYYNDKMLGKENDDIKGKHGLSIRRGMGLLWNFTEKEKIRAALDLAALSGVTLERHEPFSVESKVRSGENGTISELEISIPESVNFELNTPALFGEVSRKYDIESGLIKEYIMIKDDAYTIPSIKYNGKVDKVIINSNIAENIFKDDDLERMRLNGLSISKLIMNSNQSAYIDTEDLKSKIADEIIVNISDKNNGKKDSVGNSPGFNRGFEDKIYDEIQSEINDPQEEFVDMYELDDDFSDDGKYEKFVKDLNIKGKIKDDIDLFREDIKNKTFSSSENDMRHFDGAINIGRGVSNKFTINAPNRNIRVGLTDLNMNLDIAADKIDLKYLLFGEVPSSNILKIVNQKSIKSSYPELLNNVKNGKDISVGTINSSLPTIEIKAKEVRLVEASDDERNDERDDD